jgi:hypothetical protein
MTLSPKAQRFVIEALEHLSAADSARLREFLEHNPGADLPRGMAALALTAVQHQRAVLQDQLRSIEYEDQRAEVGNDMAYYRAIENDLRRVVPQHA